MTQLFEFLARGGPALWAIAILSVLTLTIGLWRLSGYLSAGVWASAGSGGRPADRVAHAAAAARGNPGFDAEMAVNETTRIAKRELAGLRQGLRALELIAVIAPLIGLLGTVLGMIEAFQALQEAGAGADPSVLAGGIWEALLTTAAGMAVAIPASVLLTWFESIAEREQGRMEDAATQVFNTPIPKDAA